MIHVMSVIREEVGEGERGCVATIMIMVTIIKAIEAALLGSIYLSSGSDKNN